LEPIHVSGHRQIAAAHLSDHPYLALSRRQVIAGAAAAALLQLPARSAAQTSPDGAQILRARVRKTSDGLGYDGTLPGPTLRVRHGEELKVRLINELAAPTSIHWHGVRVPNAMDGVPGLTQAAVAPGASFDYRFRPPDAGTFWYHALPGADIDRGLHGALIVDDARPVAIDRELVLVLSLPPAPDAGPVVINGATRPDFSVNAGERLRIRLINATAARGVVLRFDGHVAWLVAVDGQPSEPFLTREGRVALGPGSRIDLILDASRGGGTVAPILAGDGGGVPVARLVYRTGGRPAGGAVRPEPPQLPPAQLPARIDLRTALRQDLDLARLKSLNPAGAPLFTARRGRAVALTLRNGGGAPQVVHLHGHSFRHLDRLDDGWKPYWLDTMVIGSDTERIAFVADNPGKWLIESRALERPDSTGEAYFIVS
jgi:FtsP/CotA-like multicopper oxidase with cupredoxin domain